MLKKKLSLSQKQTKTAEFVFQIKPNICEISKGFIGIQIAKLLLGMFINAVP